MKEFSQRSVLGLLLALPLLGGCAGNVCNQLGFENVPELTPPLVMPEGVPAITEGGEFSIPNAGDANPVEGCLAKPPMTLPPEALEDPEEREEEA